jgi:membrane associated rhomboid family serine protease
MIPLRDNNPTRRVPVVTLALILANVIAFILDLATQRSEVVEVLTPYGVMLARRHVGGLADNYALVPANLMADFGGTWMTVVTSMFLHANWLHILGNMLYLWIFGNNVEDTLGHLGFLLFYVVCGVAAAAVHVALGPGSEIPTIGASGAVAGVMGAYLILFPQARVLALVPIVFFTTLMEVPAMIVIGFWAVIQFLNVNWLGGGELRGGGVAYGAHVGGFLCGLILVSVLGGRSLVTRARGRRYDDEW